MGKDQPQRPAAKRDLILQLHNGITIERKKRVPDWVNQQDPAYIAHTGRALN